MKCEADLVHTLRRIDGRGYKAYKDIAGNYQMKGWSLHVDYVQGDPFASPSKVRVRVAMSEAGFPGDLFSNKIRRIALEDAVSRRVRDVIRREARGRRGSGKSGAVSIDAGGQEVLERTAVRATDSWVEARISVGLPAAGRRVLAREAEAMLVRELGAVAASGLCFEHFDEKRLREFVYCIENQEAIRAELKERKLVSFIANGSLLPRSSGVSDAPLARKETELWSSPEELHQVFSLPNPLPSGETVVSGTGIPEGVTLIVGGGYHGKSTVLRALELGVYPHIPGDGRDYVVTVADAVKIRAEDGRSVEKVDISPFISNLPRGKSTVRFSTEDASGSTSQAASIMEALECGTTALLVDEDTSATNFMIRDARMQELVHKEMEPITPFLDRVRELYESEGVSSVLVVGGSGDYFDAADTVILMKEYQAEDATSPARKIAEKMPTNRKVEAEPFVRTASVRVPRKSSFDASRGRREVKIDAKSRELILYGEQAIELRALEQLVDKSQTRAIGSAILLASREFVDGKRTIPEVLRLLDEYLDSNGIDALDVTRRGEKFPGIFARPRKEEVQAAINRMRSLRIGG